LLFSTQNFITIHGAFTFQKLPNHSDSLTVIRKLLSYILVTHMSQILRTCFKKYQVWHRRSCWNLHPVHLKVCTSDEASTFGLGVSRLVWRAIGCLRV